MQVVSGIQALRDTLGWRRSGATVGLVVTKGNLHQGHTALIGASLANHTLTVVATYAGPSLFFDQGSYQAYPQSDVADQELLQDLGVDVLFTPSEGDLYPRGYTGLVKVAQPRIGVAHLSAAEHNYSIELSTLLLKLCHIVAPDTLFYGEKDYQQLFKTQLMLQDLELSIALHRIPIVRDSDRLAVATRNAGLTVAQRANAPVLYQTLSDLASAIRAGARNFAKLEQTGRVVLRGAGFKTDYLWVCDAATLENPDAQTREFRILGAARLGKIRLIDNIALRI